MKSVSLDAVLFVEILGLSIAYGGYVIPTHFKGLSLMINAFTRRTGPMKPFYDIFTSKTQLKNTQLILDMKFFLKSVSLVCVRFVEALD